MSAPTKGIDFRANSVIAVHDSSLRAAIRNATDSFTLKRAEVSAHVPLEEWREAASRVRLEVLGDLSSYADRFATNAKIAGAVVHRAQDSAAANDIVADILREHLVTKVVKSKSMVSEEIQLNRHLEKQGVTVVETDLGEYIIQLAGEHPSHIIVPAIHRDRKRIGKLFAEELACDYSEDPRRLTNIARGILREEFLSAQAAISGANFAIADSGSIVIFTNEGNGRMCTSLPPLHIAVLSIEKMIPSLADLPKFMRLLPRSATGQVITSYVSIITGTRKAHEATGARELHLVLIDNGRSEIVNGPYREMLKCIRCGACLNACPVYRTVGGHAYDTTYPGPMGTVLTTLLNGIDKAHQLLDACTLCGACKDVCPVKVPIPRLLRGLREEKVQLGLTSGIERVGMAGFGLAVKSAGLFQLGQTAARWFWPIARTLGGKAGLQRMPPPAKTTLRRRVP